MNKSLKTLIILIGIFLVILILGPLYTVPEGEQVVVTRFGRITQVHTEAGLKVKMPLIDSLTRYSKKIISWDGDPQRIPTSENQFIWIDTTARWLISDPAKFYESVTSINQAYARLDDIIDSAVRTIVAQNPLTESVRSTNIILDSRGTAAGQAEADAAAIAAGSEEGEGPNFSVTTDQVFDRIEYGREDLSDQMLIRSKVLMPQYGIELMDVVIRQIRYSEDLTRSVFDRMIKERNQIAQAYRSYGEGKKAEWLGKLDREKRSILSGAFATAEAIKAEGDSEAARIYSDAYGQAPEFYSFWKSLESYRKSLPSQRKVLSTDMDYFRYLYDPEG